MAASTLDMLRRREKLLGPNISTFYDEPVHLVKGEGVWVWDAEGNKYLDCYNNVPHVGHCHPRVVDAICKQAATLNKIPDTLQYHPCAQAFLDAYQSRRKIDLVHLPLFRALRAFTYVGWIMTRLEQPGSEARLKNFIAITEHHLTLL